jgi:hypothetical protein
MTPPSARTPGRLTINSSFTVVDPEQRRLHDHARALGFADLDSYLQALCQQQASLAQLARELGTTPPARSATRWTPHASPRRPAG